MALVVKDRVRETSVTAGTGPVTLSGAVSGFQSFSVIGNGNTTYYCIVDPTAGTWEVGVGTYTASGPSLSRDTVFESSNSGSLVSFAANAKDVFCTYPAERSIYTDAVGSAITPATASILGVPSGGTGLSTLTLNQVPYGNGTSAFQSSASLTFDGTTLTTNTVSATTVNATTADLTNIEVTNVKAKDGTASATIADTTGYWTFSGTGAFTTPKGNSTTERPGTPVTGMLRYNTTSNEFEGYSGASASWKSVGGAAISNDTSTASDLYPAFLTATTGTASTINTSNAKLLYKPSTGELKVSAPVASNGILVNSTTMAASYTIATGTNGLSVGPFTINSGVTLTIDSGQRHLIL